MANCLPNLAVERRTSEEVNSTLMCRCKNMGIPYRLASSPNQEEDFVLTNADADHFPPGHACKEASSHEVSAYLKISKSF